MSRFHRAGGHGKAVSRSIALITLVVPDYDQALAFYVDTLGFELIEDTPLANGKRWVRVSPDPDAERSATLLLAKADGADQAASVGWQTGKRVAFFLETSDFDLDYRAMRKAGVRFEEEPREEAYGKVAVWRDPFGNRWDLVEPKELD